MNGKPLIGVILVLLIYVQSASTDCVIDRTNFDKDTPIILRNNYYDFTNIVKAVHYPKSAKGIIIRDNVAVYLACPGSQIKIQEVLRHESVRKFTCFKGKFDNYFFIDIRCQSIPKPTVKVDEKSITVGFNISKGPNHTFLTQIEGVFNDESLTTYYIEHLLHNNINNFKLPTHELSFVKPLSKNCKDCYAIQKQISTISGLFTGKTKHIVNGYFDSHGKYLAKGHLAPRADFMFSYQQKATFFYYNCVPQWQQINCANWKSLERAIREMAGQSPHPLRVYTGASGVSQFFGKNLFLCVEGANRQIPVPKFTWKIVQDPSSKTAMAFVMSNNPYRLQESESFTCTKFIPTSYSSLNKLCTSSRHNCNNWYEKGCLYCCVVDQTLRRMIPHLPAM